MRKWNRSEDSSESFLQFYKFFFNVNTDSLFLVFQVIWLVRSRWLVKNIIQFLPIEYHDKMGSPNVRTRQSSSAISHLKNVFHITKRAKGRHTRGS